jgi:hypothetical protein
MEEEDHTPLDCLWEEPGSKLEHLRRSDPGKRDNKPNFSRGMRLQWAGSRERKSRIRSRENFFLDIPLYRTHRQVNERYG